MKTNLILLLLALSLTASPLAAQGLLGEHYFGAAYENGDAEDIEAVGGRLLYNRPLFADREYGYDLSVHASYAEVERNATDTDTVGLEAGLVIYPIENMELKPFLSAHVGFGEPIALGSTHQSFVYRVTLGGEWRASERLSFTPRVTYFDYIDAPEGDDITLGIDGDLWLDARNSVGVGFSRTSDQGFDFDVFSVQYRHAF